jgi:hypothetical protein
MKIKLEKISFKMRIAIVASVIWFLFFFIGFFLNINTRQRQDELLFIAIFPLLIGWGIWWIFSGYISEKKIKKTAANFPQQLDFDSSKNDEPKRKTIVTVIKKPFNPAIYNWLCFSVLASLTIIGFLVYENNFTLASSINITIEWLLKTFLLSIFWGSIAVGITSNWGKNRKNVFLGTICVMSLVSAGIVFAPFKNTIKNQKVVEYSLKAQDSFWGISLGSSKSDVFLIKGKPTEIGNDGKIWRYYVIGDKDKKPYQYYSIQFIDDEVFSIGYRASEPSDSLELCGIKLFDTPERVKELLGKPFEVQKRKEKNDFRFFYDKYNTFFHFRENKVIFLGIYKLDSNQVKSVKN